MLKSAGGIISLLDETNPKLKSLALTKLDQIVDAFWPEIADVVAKIETLYEDSAFVDRKKAALVASKVYYHLGSYEDALTFALGAQELFDVNLHSEYTDTIISKCIDFYIKLRNNNAECKDEKDRKAVDPQLEAVVDRMFERCFLHKQYKQALGIALEARRLDMLVRAIKDSDDVPGLLYYSVKTVLSLIQNRKYRGDLLRCLIELYAKLPQPDFINMSQCLIFLEDPQSVADILDKLTQESSNTALMAYQIAFDLYDSATQQFVAKIVSSLKLRAPAAIPGDTALALASTTTTDFTAQSKTLSSTTDDAHTVAMDTSDGSSTVELSQDSKAPPKPRSRAELSGNELAKQERIERLVKILSGDETVYMHLQFLVKNNKTDMLILKNIKDNVRNSIGHTATVIANGFMHSGTTCDDFLRDNIEWVGKATNWAKFSAVASLGVIHRGHESEAMRLLESYLPKDSAAGSSGYMEGGGLFALGLVFANHGAGAIDYLKNQLQAATGENVRHGAALGLGLAAMGTERADVYDLLRQNLYQDDAVTGEAAGLAMGLVMVGSKNSDTIRDMVTYAQETQHEKILRGLSVGIALTMFARLEEADALVESLLRDKDSILRRSGVYTLAMAYCGTGNNQAVRKLLHIAVSDVNDDVRRSAVMSLGFLLFRTPEQCPTMVSLLSESYNAHVRYGAALALGVACAGSGSKEAVTLLEPMLNDPVNYVRQGCLIALAFIYMQHNENTCAKVKEFRASLTKVITDKHEDVMVKFGAIFAQGIIDAGGRNVTISLQSRHGHTDMQSVVAVLVFMQYWYWFPFAHFLTLAFRPTCLIGLNSDLKMPKLEFMSSAKPSMYSYPPPLEEKQVKQQERVEAAVLSVTAKAKRREKAKQELDRMDVDEQAADKKDDTPPPAAKKEDEKKEPAEPSVQMLPNPARVMKPQLKVVTLPGSSRYEALKNVNHGGIIMLKDKSPDQPAEMVELVKGGGTKTTDDEKEPDAPDAFEFVEGQE